MTDEQARMKVEELTVLLRRWQKEYYVEADPSVSDVEYDRCFDELLQLEKLFPALASAESPTARVGSDLSSDLPEVDHSIPVLSLDKAYSLEEVKSWMEKTAKAAGGRLSFSLEEKIDGISIVLYYREGRLDRAVTRGNGFRGNDVTANVRTIGAVPLILPEPVNLTVRGEIYLPKADFEKVRNQGETVYANPRNLTAGTIRRKVSREVARIPLTLFVYEGFFEQPCETHGEALSRLSRLGFRLNPRTLFLAEDSLDSAILSGREVRPFDFLEEALQQAAHDREGLGYEIDGLVFKVNETSVRESLGYTGHHPRWALAYKFESPRGVSQIVSIDVQVGRTGRITPVARIHPVEIGGSIIANVTLHNQDYINSLEAAVGDEVAVSKRGDVIPAVEEVLEKNTDGHPVWQMPKICPSCHSKLIKQGAHHFCPNPGCPDQLRQRLAFFVGKGGMDIENLGPETLNFLIEEGLITSMAELYTFDYTELEGRPGFGEKKITLISQGLKKSRKAPYKQVLAALGIPDLGPRVAELLIENGLLSVNDLISIALNGDEERLVAIPGIAEKKAGRLIEEFQQPATLETIASLKEAGLRFEEEAPDEPLSSRFEGQTWCITGSFENYKPRSQAGEEIKARGGKVTTSVTSKTTHLLAGSSAGSKLIKARDLGTIVVTEEEFREMLHDSE